MHSSYFLSNYAEFEFCELDLESSEVSGRIIAIGLVARVLLYNIISVRMYGDQFAIENMFRFLEQSSIYFHVFLVRVHNGNFINFIDKFSLSLFYKELLYIL